MEAQIFLVIAFNFPFLSSKTSSTSPDLLCKEMYTLLSHWMWEFISSLKEEGGKDGSCNEN
jgi:hypothetical protein